MNLDLFGHWYLARSVLTVATFVAFALFLALIRFVQQRSERCACDAAREDAGTARTPQNWNSPAPGLDPPIGQPDGRSRAVFTPSLCEPRVILRRLDAVSDRMAIHRA